MSSTAFNLALQEGDGIPDLALTKEVIASLRRVGFEVLEYKDLADESEIPWYQPLDGNMSLSNFRQTKAGRWLTHKLVNVLEFVGLAPKGTVKTHDFLIKVCGARFVTHSVTRTVRRLLTACARVASWASSRRCTFSLLASPPRKNQLHSSQYLSCIVTLVKTRTTERPL